MGLNESSKEVRILVIDDEPTFIEAMTWWLKGKYQVVPVVGGQSALETLQKENGKFDVVLCDLNMPKLDGMAVYRFISENYPGLEKKVIFLSGGAYTQKSLDFLKSNRIQSLDKPFSRDELCGMIDQVCRNF